MKKIIILCLILIVSVFLVSSFGVQKSSIKISKASLEVINEFENTPDKVEVVLKIKEEKISSKSSSKKEEAIRYITKNISLEELESLESNSSIEKVFSKFHIRSFLQESSGIILSNSTNLLQINSINLTGVNQTICIIDTGINFSHPDLIGKNASCVVDCFNKACVENCSIGDDNGHGTHVAGIAAAYGSISGIATNSSLIGVKVLDSNGDGGSSSNLNNAIDYCVARNVSVISLSLGTASLYSNYCDNVGGLSDWRNSINSAVQKNISVVVASGNDANTTSISAPACFSNSTAVADTYDADIGGVTWTGTCTDSTTSVDKIVCHANRNSLVKLLAPGALINSTSTSGTYEEQGGTSMSAPMVSGAIAIINSLLNLTNQQKNTTQITQVLFDTGKKISEGSNNFSRINLYNATLSLDNINPSVNLISPSNNHLNLTSNQTFECNTTDWQLSNLTFQIWNSTSIYYNESINFSGISNSSTFSLTNMPQNTYTWNCLVYDEKSNFASSSSNFTLIIGGVSTSLINPSNNFYSSQNSKNFTCNSTSDELSTLSNSTFYLWNSSDILFYNETKNISGTSNSSTYNYTFSTDQNYTWNCLSINNQSQSSFADQNYTFIYDTTIPTISNLSSSITSSSATISWTTNEPTNSSINISTQEVNSSSFSTSHSLELTGLNNSESYDFNLTSCDQAGNCNSSNSTFTTSTPPVSSSSGGGSSGGGGGGGAPAFSSSSSNKTTEDKNLSIKNEELKEGKTIQLKNKEKISLQLNSSNHSLTINELNESGAKIVIQSEPLEIFLEINQEIKLNLTSPNYYDLYLKLNNISNNSVDLTIKEIYEKINLSNNEIEKSPNPLKNLQLKIASLTNSLDRNQVILSSSILILAIAIIYLGIILNKKKKLKALNSLGDQNNKDSRWKNKKQKRTRN